MKRIPRITRSGDFSSVWNSVIAPTLDENFREARVQPGVGCTVSSTTSGQSVLVRPNPAQITRKPFDLLLSGSGVTIWPGLVNGIMADNFFSPFQVDTTQQNYVVAKVTTDGTQVTAVSMSVSGSAPDPQTPATNSYPASVDVLVGLINEGLTYNLSGGNNALLRYESLSTAPDTFSGIWTISF